DIAREIVGDLQSEPGGVQVSVAIAWLYEELNEAARSHYSGTRMWARLNRRALPYEAEDLELVLDLLAGRQYGMIWATPLVRAIERYAAKAPVPDEWHDPLSALLADAAGARQAEYQKLAVAIRAQLGTAPSGGETLDLSPLDGADAWSTTARRRLEERHGN